MHRLVRITSAWRSINYPPSLTPFSSLLPSQHVCKLQRVSTTLQNGQTRRRRIDERPPRHKIPTQYQTRQRPTFIPVFDLSSLRNPDAGIRELFNSECVNNGTVIIFHDSLRRHSAQAGCLSSHPPYYTRSKTVNDRCCFFHSGLVDIDSITR